jgi:hypothetical protein
MRKKLVLALLAILPVEATHAAQWLKANDITYVFVGRDIAGIYRNGATFTETYRSIGKIAYKDAESAASGTWTQKEDQFCTTYDGLPGGCYRIRMLSPNCYEYWLVGADGTTANDWIARGWQVKYPPTCPKE